MWLIKYTHEAHIFLTQHHKGADMGKKIFGPAAIVFSGIIALSAIGNPVIGGWTVNADASGAVASMTLSNPRTTLNIEKTIDLSMDNREMPVRGMVKFLDGIQRDLNSPEEVTFCYKQYGGAHAQWDYSVSMNRVTLFNPDETSIPTTMFGGTTRVIAKSGAEYFGKLIEMPGCPDWFKMETGDARVMIYRHAISLLQQIK
jgi:hypothetical protein